jgi:hypothetical protein
MKYRQALKSLLAILILIIIIYSCSEEKGEVISGYIPDDAELEINNVCGSYMTQILVVTDSGKSIYFTLPPGADWKGSELLTHRASGKRIYVKGIYYEHKCPRCHISFAYVKD